MKSLHIISYQQRDWKYIFLVMALLVLWASSYVGIRVSLAGYSAINLAFLRYLTASIAFIPFAVARKISLPKVSDIPLLFLSGLVGFALYNVLLNSGERTVGAGVTSLMMSTTPFFTLFLARLFGQEKIKLKDGVGMIISFIGVAVVVWFQGNGLTFDTNVFFIVTASACVAFYFVLQKKLMTRYSPLEITAFSIWSGTLLLFPFTQDAFGSVQHARELQTFSMVYLGLFPGMIAYVMMAYILKHYKVSNVSSCLFLIPFITVFLGWIMLSEIPTTATWLGGLLIIAGVLIKNLSK
jgi:drug/metabolite transporter (DMT)-like permease